MNKPRFSLICLMAVVIALRAVCAEPRAGESPADHLPPHITQVTWFGERAEWSHDGKRILFLTKTFGDAMELNLDAKTIRNLTAHYPHHGYTRALYLANGDILLSGPEAVDPAKLSAARGRCGTAHPAGYEVQRGPGGIAEAHAHRVDPRERAVPGGHARGELAHPGG